VEVPANRVNRMAASAGSQPTAVAVTALMARALAPLAPSRLATAHAQSPARGLPIALAVPLLVMPPILVTSALVGLAARLPAQPTASVLKGSCVSGVPA
jgi:hypothetical protein